ncbi:MAG TPA: TonB-dependent receptor [Vicinamibacteria bacterium]|nr:TonB-dependent receptor [Vicinamibacteria bacterium]
MKRIWLGLACCLFLLTPRTSWPQASSSTGRIEGTVMDATGGTVAGAKVAVRNSATGISKQQTTDSGGHFIFPNLSPGAYDVSIEKEGFSSASLKGSVTVGTTTSLHAVLAVGNIQTRVEVEASQPLVDPRTSSVSALIGQETIGTLPLNGRNFVDYVLLTPGATTDGDFGMVSFNGIAGNFNNYSVDGANDNNAFFAQQIGRGTIPFQFSEDVIQEFQVTSNGFQAEFGQAGGGLVNSVTKSGGNDVHGDAYYYFLDSSLNANDAINKERGIPKPANRRQQFGASLSGPLIKGKLFYFVNYEGQLRNEPVTVNNSPALNGLPPDFFAQNPGLAAQVNAASGLFPRTFNQNTAFAKLSGTAGSKSTFNLTYNFQHFVSPHGYFITPTSTGDSLDLTDGSTSHFVQASLLTNFSSSSFNELRVHFLNDHHEDLPLSPATQSTTVIQNPDTGFVFGGNRFQLSTSDQRWEFADNVTKLKGRHTVKAGVDINVNHDSDYFLYGPKGVYTFQDLPSVATGTYQFYLQSFGETTTNFTIPTFSVYAQDEFRVSPRFTLDYGLRWDLQKYAQPKVCNPAFAPTCSIPVDYHNFAPRLGFAYLLDQNGHTVLRGSGGIFYLQMDYLDMSQALVENGVLRQFVFIAGPAFGNSNPAVNYPYTLPGFPGGAGGTPSLNTIDPKFRSPYVEQANLSIEHQFGSHTALRVGYVYTHGVRLLGGANGVTRQAIAGYDANLVPPDQQTNFGGSFNTDIVVFPDGHKVVVPDNSAIEGFLDPGFSSIGVVKNTGESVYNALQVLLRYSSDQLHGSLAYTLSKTTDQGTGYYNQFDIPSQRGLSSLDQTHRLVVAGSWSPRAGVLKDFTLGMVATVASGRPYTALLDSAEPNFQMVPGPAFNSFRTPYTEDVDLTVARNFSLGQRLRLRLTAQVYDLFNHQNFQPAVDQVQYTTAQTDNVFVATPNPHFGVPLAISIRNGSRNVQFAARIEF